MRAQLISWLRNDITPAVRQSRAPEKELLKFATAQNLPPAQLEALAQLYNTAATVAYLDKSASRGGNFHIVEVPELVREYLSIRPASQPETKRAGRDAITSPAWENTGILGSLHSLPRCFASFSQVPVTWDVEQDHPIQIKLAGAKAPSKEERRQESERQVLIEQAKQAVYNLNEDLRGELDGIKMLFRTWDPPAFDAAESDFLLQHGDGAKQACDAAAQWLAEAKVTVKRAAGPGSRRLIRETPLFAKLAGVKALLDQRRELLDELAKHAAERAKPTETDEPETSPRGQVRETRGRPRSEGLSRAERANQEFWPSLRRVDLPARQPVEHTSAPGGTPPRLSDELPGIESILGEGSWVQNDGPKQVEGALAGLSSGLDSWTSKDTVLGNLFRDRFKSVLDERSNSRQKTVDQGMSNARRQAMLQNLLITDEVLSEADPEHVVALYNSLAETMPEIASDPNVMRMALRSAIQHDGISPFDIKQMTEAETAGQQRRMNQKMLDAVEYKGVDPGAPKTVRK